MKQTRSEILRKCKNFVKTMSFTAATINCLKEFVEFSALIAQYLKFYCHINNFSSYFNKCLTSLAIFLSFCLSVHNTYILLNKYMNTIYTNIQFILSNKYMNTIYTYIQFILLNKYMMGYIHMYNLYY